jgi:Flp pilus assembly protein TadG
MIMFTMMLPFVLIPLVGLAIDTTVLYTAQLKLQTAVDGGALAAADALSAGLSVSAQQAAMTLAADQFMKANLSNGGNGNFFGSYNFNDEQCNQANGKIVPTGTPPGPITYTNQGNCIALIQDDVNKMRNVQIVASLTVPLLFMRILGFSTGTVTATGTASRRDVVMVMVIDRSGSMGAEMSALQQGATLFVSNFQGGRDKLGLVLMSGSSVVAYPPTDWGTYPPTGAGWQAHAPSGPDTHFNDETETPDMIDSLNSMVSAGGNTGMAEALQIAYKELQAANEPGALNIIVLWTDGEPNGITIDANYGTLGSATNYLQNTYNSTNHTYTNTSGCTNSSDTTSTGTYPSVAATSIIGWIAQWGGYASTGGNAPRTNGIFTRANNTNGPATGTFGNHTSVAGWVASTYINNDNNSGTTNSNESELDNSGTSTGPAKGCSYVSPGSGTNGGSNLNVVLTGIPATDWFGDSTTGSSVSPYTQHDFTQAAIWSATPSTSGCASGGSGTGVGPASGPLQLTGTLTGNTTTGANNPITNACQLGLAAWNAADMAGRTIHQDTTITPIVYTMGYAGSVTGSGGVDVALLERLANCAPGVPCSPGADNATNTVYVSQGTASQYNPSGTIPTGMYIQIQETTDVTPAFQTLLSQILRLSH